MTADQPVDERDVDDPCRIRHVLPLGGANPLSRRVCRTGWTVAECCHRNRLREHGFAAAIDLRTPEELDENCEVPANAVRIPIDIPDARGLLAGQPCVHDYRQLYLNMLRHRGPSIASVMTALATHSPSPVVLGCSLGKDRTGLIVGMLGRMLSTPVRTTVERESAARRAILDCPRALRTYVDRRGSSVREMRRRCEVGTTVLYEALETVMAEHGGVWNYLGHHGLAEEAGHVLSRMPGH